MNIRDRWADCSPEHQPCGCQHDCLVEAKVVQAMATIPRLEATRNGVNAITRAEREHMLRVSFSEVARATSLETMMDAPAPMLEQLSVLALVHNENINGILTQVIRVFMSLWASPETHDAAIATLERMEADMRKLMANMPAERVRSTYTWAAKPSSATARRDAEGRALKPTANQPETKESIEAERLAERRRCIDILRCLTQEGVYGPEVRRHNSHQARALASAAQDLIGSPTAERQWRTEIRKSTAHSREGAGC